MKNRLLLIAAMAFTFFQATAQTNGHFSFSWKLRTAEESSDSNIDMYFSPKCFVVVATDEQITEKVVIDRSIKSGIEILREIEGEYADSTYYSNLSWEESVLDADYVSEIMEAIFSMPDFNSGLEMLKEKKTIKGLPCQKFQINFPENIGVATGWIALGVHGMIEEDLNFMDTEQGMVIELSIEINNEKVEILCTGYDSKFPITDGIYSLAIPAGAHKFDVQGYLEEYYDDEEYPDDEYSDEEEEE